jgi:uroporphyrinogen decarboxylase
LASERFQNALNSVQQPIPPIWMMRQAGRYHSHYQDLRKTYSFVDICRIPEVAAEAARGPVADFDFDLAILFSDILFPLEALGLGLTYDDGGPKLAPHLEASHIDGFRPLAEALPRLQFQGDAVRLTREVLPKDKSLIGFVGGPWTLYVYAVEGSHQGSLRKSKADPGLWHAFEERIVELLIENIRLQLDAGAEVVMVLDTAAGEVSPDWFGREVLPGVAKIVRAFPGKIGYYSKGSQPAHLRDPLLEEIPLGGVGVDWRWDMTEALSLFGGRGIVQGNFDPAMLFLTRDDFAAELRRWLEPIRALSPGERRGWVCGLGHGILPATPEENVRAFVRMVREAFA